MTFWLITPNFPIFHGTCLVINFIYCITISRQIVQLILVGTIVFVWEKTWRNATCPIWWPHDFSHTAVRGQYITMESVTQHTLLSIIFLNLHAYWRNYCWYLNKYLSTLLREMKALKVLRDSANVCTELVLTCYIDIDTFWFIDLCRFFYNLKKVKFDIMTPTETLKYRWSCNVSFDCAMMI